MAPKQASHIVVMPKYFRVLRTFQMIFALIPLGICIFGVVYITLDAFILNIFTAAATIISLIYIRVATYHAPGIYQYWAILSLEIFCLIFWLVSFALLAHDVAVVSLYLNYSSYRYGYSSYTSTYYWAAKDFIAIFGSCTGAGAIEFILFIISLSIFGTSMARHRSNGGHCVPNSTISANPPPQYSYPDHDYGNQKMVVESQGQIHPSQNFNNVSTVYYQSTPQQVLPEVAESPRPYHTQPFQQQYPRHQYQ